MGDIIEGAGRARVRGATMTYQLVNVVGFNAGWFACVLSAAGGVPWAGLIGVAALVVLHLWMMPHPRREVALLLLAGLVGAIIDSVQMQLGVFSFPGHGPMAWLCPIWLIALWVNFATTFHVSGRWLRGRYLLAAALGALSGPCSYFAGARMGAMRMHPNPTIATAGIALGWAVAMPVLVHAAALTEAPAKS